MLRHGKSIVGILVVLLILVSYWGWVQSRTAGGQGKIWVASEDILPGEIITEKKLRAVATESTYEGIPLENILGKKALLKIPAGAVVSVGLEEPKSYEGSLVNIPVSLKTAGVLTPGDVVELIGVSDNAQIIESLGPVKIVAAIDKNGQIFYERDEDTVPAVLVVEVPAERVVSILEFLVGGNVYPILGGVEIDDIIDGE